MSDETSEPKPQSKRGYALVDPERRREIARKGGIAAHQRGTAHEFTSEEGKAAGKKGGAVMAARRRAAREDAGA